MDFILIIGAKSDIAKATARQYAKNGYNICLAARGVDNLEDFSKDIAIRFQVKVKLHEFDVCDFTSHQSFYEQLEEKPLGVICMAGYLGDQQKSQTDFNEVRCIIDTNYTGIVSFLNIVANDFEKRKQGFIVGVSSVAGDRGRMSNYTYGSAKAALTAYLSGLRNRLYSSQVHVMTVKPGFVLTKMTKDMNLPKRLTAYPDEVAKDIYFAQQKGKSVLYTKWFWKWIMLIIVHIPEWKFRGMNI